MTRLLEACQLEHGDHVDLGAGRLHRVLRVHQRGEYGPVRLFLLGEGALYDVVLGAGDPVRVAA